MLIKQHHGHELLELDESLMSLKRIWTKNDIETRSRTNDNNLFSDIGKDQDVSGEGSSQNEDEDDDDDDDKASGEAKTEDKPDEPIRLDTDPRGEPVVAKLINQPIKFNDALGKAMHVEHVKNKKLIKTVNDAQPKVEQQKKVIKKVENDNVEKKVKQVKKLQKSDKPKTAQPKKLKN